MIKNETRFAVPLTETELALEFVEYSVEDFYLTGSRFFGNPSKDSDWDFFANYDTCLLSNLLLNGFAEISQGKYDKCNIHSLFERGNVQIQIVTDVNQKNRIQLAIKDFYSTEYQKMSKIQRKHLWNLLYNV